jgi:GGDEF domain-containing protein
MTAEDNNRLNTTLGHVQEEYSAWFFQVLARVFYPGTEGQISLKSPHSVPAWLESLDQEKTIPGKILVGQHKDLIATAEHAIADAEKYEKIPPYESFKKLVMLYEEFCHGVTRIAQNQKEDAPGFDPVTGLRIGEMFYKDVRLEMDRLARQGKEFSVALVRIDGGEEELESQQRPVAEVLKEIVRSFDDAYRVDERYFILSLKQTDTDGAIRAIERVNSMLAEKKSRTTVSAIVVTPVPGVDLREILGMMKRELEENAGEAAVIMEHLELSPLQRLLKDRKS